MDQFADYAERGHLFAQAVTEYVEGISGDDIPDDPAD
jgi:hypothetical protein